MGKKEFTTAVFNPKSETFVVYIALLSFNALLNFSPLKLNVYTSRRPQISGLIAEETPTKVPAEYSNFTDVFSQDLVSEHLEYKKINDYVLKLVKVSSHLLDPSTV